MSPSETHQHGPRIGYVLKMYPRFSETFILGEILAMERHGADLEIFSLRLPSDGRFHAEVARVTAPVTYIDAPAKTVQLWDVLRSGRRAFPESLDGQLSELLSVDPVDAGQAVALAEEVLARRIDHLHAHFGSVSTTVARLAARLAGVTYSFTAHAKDIYHRDVDHDDLAAKLDDAAFVVTVSDFNLDYLKHTYGSSAAGVLRLYNGLDLQTFEMIEPAHRQPIVAAVGRLVEKKGFGCLIDAIGLLSDEGRKVELVVIGTGELEPALRQQVARLGLTDTVRFLGPLPQTRTREVIREAAVLAAPCVLGSDGNRDGLPTVILEGLALGTPVVSTPVTGIPEAVLDGETGLLVPEGDVPALAAAIAKLLDNPRLRCELAVRGRQLIESHFDGHQNSQTLLRWITEASARPKTVRP